MTGKPLTILGIETSCDETAAAVVRGLCPARAKFCPISCSARPRRMRPMAGWCRKSPRRAHLEILDGVIARALCGRANQPEGRGRHRRHRRPRPDRRGDGGTDHRQGAGAGAWQAADRGQSPDGPCHDRAADAWRGVSLPAASGVGRPLPACRAWAACTISAFTAAPLMMRWARPSTRPRRYWGSPYPGGPAVEAAAKNGNPQRP